MGSGSLPLTALSCQRATGATCKAREAEHQGLLCFAQPGKDNGLNVGHRQALGLSCKISLNVA